MRILGLPCSIKVCLQSPAGLFFLYAATHHVSRSSTRLLVYMSQPKTVVVGLSGGVDSAVSAYLLKEQGYRVIGIFMKNWEDDDDSEYCSTRQDFLDAAAVADVLGIELQAVNFATEYKDRVFAEFLREYQAGRTPNPDVLCNAEIKFKAFLDHAFAQGADLIATGHYARVRQRDDGLVELLRGLDESKDQSYFLHRLSQAQLDRVLFPVGEIQRRRFVRLQSRLACRMPRKKTPLASASSVSGRFASFSTDTWPARRGRS